jgi:N-acetylglucosamine-6-sulfatase
MANLLDHIIRSHCRAAAAACLGALSAAAPSSSAAQGAPTLRGAAARPNVIVILSDDHRYDFMGFHPGAPRWLRTPAMDRMAREGAHVRNAFVSTALCSPSRASILTGQYAHRHGVVDNQRDVPAGTRFFPEYLQAAGYRTAMIGKWHLGMDRMGRRPGFDQWISFRGQGAYSNPTLDVNGREAALTGYTADILTDSALAWMERQRRAGRPFFLHLAHKSVHALFEPAPRHQGRFSDSTVRYPATMRPDAAGAETWPDWVRAQRSSWHGVDYMYHGALDYDRFHRQYAETLLGLDDSIGRVLDYLDRTGLARNTVVLYMGDNGFSFGEHGLIDKRHAFEESMRVPMLVWSPGRVRPGAQVSQMVMNVDVAPTILALAGARVPRSHALDGRSFLPALGGNAAGGRDAVLYEYFWEWNYPQTPTQFALRTDRHKYVFYHGVWDRDALFDLAADPHEATNLVDRPEHRALADSLRNRLFDVLESTGGTSIPLRRPRNERMDRRRPAGAPSTDPFLKRKPGS